METEESHFNEINRENGAKKAEIAAYIDFSTDFHIFDTKWVPSFPTKFVIVGATTKSSQRGSIQIYQLNNDQLDVEKIIEKKVAYRCASFDATVRNTSICLGNFHGNLQVFDIEKFDFPIYDVKAHDGIVNCLDGIGSGNGSEILTGGQDGCIKVWDPRQGDAVVCICPVRKEDGGSGRRDCWTVKFADGTNQNDRVVCAGFDNGDIKVIDLRILKESWGCNVSSGICKLSCDRKYAKTHRLVAGSVDGSVHLFDMKKNPIDKNFADFVHKPIGESSTLWSVNHLPQNTNIFATVGDSIEVWRHW